MIHIFGLYLYKVCAVVELNNSSPKLKKSSNHEVFAETMEYWLL